MAGPMMRARLTRVEYKRNRVPEVVWPDQFNVEGLAGGVVEDSDHAQAKGQDINHPDLYQTGRHQHAQDQGQDAGDGLGEVKDFSFGKAVGDDAAVRAQEQDGQVLQGGGETQGSAGVGQLEHQPGLGDRSA